MAAVDRQKWIKWVGCDRPINASLFLDDKSKAKETRERLRLAFPGLDIRDEKELRDVALGIFEQTFQATHALSIIGLLVAFAGLLLGLLSIFDESSQTWQTLKHLGFSSSRFVLSAGLEGGGIGLAAWLAGSDCRLVNGLAVNFCDQCGVFWVDLAVDYSDWKYSSFWSVDCIGWICIRGMFRNLLEDAKKMKFVIFLLVISCQLLSLGAEWIQPPNFSNKGYPVPSPDYTPLFPKDHGAHRTYGLEWWYWIGHLQTVDGDKKFGFQSTVFRLAGDPWRFE